MNYSRGESCKFVHQYDGLWCVTKKIANDLYETPERKDVHHFKEIDLIVYHSPRVDIGFAYKSKKNALAKAKELYEAGVLS